jgi:hypothetical protein
MLVTRLPPTYHGCRAADVRQFDWLRLTADTGPLEVVSVQLRGCTAIIKLERPDGREFTFTAGADATLDRMDRR